MLRRSVLFLIIALVACDQYQSVLDSLDNMIKQEEEKMYKQAPMNTRSVLPHDVQYSDDYSRKDFIEGIKYVGEQRGDEVNLNNTLTEQERLHQRLTQQQALLENQRKDQELKRKALEELMAEEERMKNPLYGLPTFDSKEAEKHFVAVCLPNMPDGIPCPVGRCYHGKCKPDHECYEDCCETAEHSEQGNSTSTIPKDNGVPCKGGNCLTGRCRLFPICVGECCDGNNIAKPNGTPCAQGHCFEGGCTSDVGCINGDCCNVHQKRLFPKGFPCHVSACQEKSFCTGLSAYCPETHSKDDDAICVGGNCKAGVCAKTGVVAENTNAKLCNSGKCCNVTSGEYLPLNTKCSNNPCMTGGYCTGFSSECTQSYNPKPEGTSCPFGKCKAGQCIAIAMCESEDECCHHGVLSPDYSVCNGGRCFRGKCVVDVPCTGECCKPHNGTGVLELQHNGLPCKNDTQVCQNGHCVSIPLCVGDCCELTGLSEDGKVCGKGIAKCEKGYCIDTSLKCTNGTCCDEHKGLLRPKGFLCQANPCSREMECIGSSHLCPLSLLHKPDGYPCPNNGQCHNGVCLLPPKNKLDCNEGPCCDLETFKYRSAGVKCGNDTCKETTYCTGSSAYCPTTLTILPDDTVCKLTDKAITDWKCLDGICREPLPIPSLDSIDIDLTRNECNGTSPCCNTLIHRVRPRGYVCSIAQTPCMKDVLCDGETTLCSPFVMEDGSACPGGSCVHGFCIKGLDPTDTEAMHEVHIHLVEKMPKQTTPEEAFQRTFAEDSEEEEEDSESMEELLTIITKEADGRITERSMRIPLNAIEKAKAQSLAMATESITKSETKANTHTEKVEAEALARIAMAKEAQLKNETTVLTNGTVVNGNQTIANATAQSAEKTKTNEKQREQRKPLTAMEEFSSAYPMPRVGTMDPITGQVRTTQTTYQCKTGKCCDQTRSVFYSRGFQCDVPKNLCRVSGCSGYDGQCHTVDRPDGAVCPNGRCFSGQCVKNCVSECCDHHNLPRPDGTKCAENGWCFDGVCVKNCTGECCSSFGFAKADGALCTHGFCLDGKCLQTRDNMGEEAKAEAIRAGLDVDSAEFVNAIPTYTHSAPRNMEEEWQKAVKKDTEKKAKEEEEIAKLKKQQEELSEAKAKAVSDVDQAILASGNDTKDNTKTTTIAMYSLLGGVGLLVIVAIIVAIIASSRRKKAQAKDDEYYDKF